MRSRSSGARADRQRGNGARRELGRLRYRRRGPARRWRRPFAASNCLDGSCRQGLAGDLASGQSSGSVSAWAVWSSARTGSAIGLTRRTISRVRAISSCSAAMQACSLSCGRAVVAPQNGQEEVTTGSYVPFRVFAGTVVWLQEFLHRFTESAVRKHRLQTRFQRQDTIAEFVNATRTVQSPVVPEYFDGAARDKRRTAGDGCALLLDPSDRRRERKWNAARQPRSGQIPKYFEEAHLRRVDASQRVLVLTQPARHCVDVRVCDIIHVGVRPAASRSNDAWQPPGAMIGNQPADEICLSRHAGPV